MVNNQMYGNQYDPNVMKDIYSINKKLEEEKDPDEQFKLKMLRLYRGMELNSTPTTRTYRGYYPY